MRTSATTYGIPNTQLVSARRYMDHCIAIHRETVEEYPGTTAHIARILWEHGPLTKIDIADLANLALNCVEHGLDELQYGERPELGYASYSYEDVPLVSGRKPNWSMRWEE